MAIDAVDPVGSLRRRLRVLGVVVLAGLGCCGFTSLGSAADHELQLGFVREGADAPFGLYLISADGGPETRLVSEPARVYAFAWSRDGSRLAFVSQRAGGASAGMYVATGAGSAERRIASGVSLSSGSGPAWAPDMRSIAFIRNGRLVLVNVDTGKERRLPSSRRSERYPAWSPDGREIAYTTTPAGRDPFGPDSRIAVTDLRTGRTRILGAGVFPVWSPDGTRLAFRNGGRLNIVSRRGGQPTPVAANVLGYGIAWSPDGRRLAFDASQRGMVYSIKTVAANGTDQRVLSESAHTQGWPTWSPDGTRIAFLSRRDFPGETGSALYVINADGTCETRLTYGASVGQPTWQPGASLEPLRC